MHNEAECSVMCKNGDVLGKIAHSSIIKLTPEPKHNITKNTVAIECLIAMNAHAITKNTSDTITLWLLKLMVTNKIKKLKIVKLYLSVTASSLLIARAKNDTQTNDMTVKCNGA